MSERLTDDECRQLVAEWDAWCDREYGSAGLPYSELWRRSKRAREHPETLIPHAEAMRQIRAQLSIGASPGDTNK